MRYIISDNTDAYFNLASEEYLLKHTDYEVTYLWRNDKAIIVGKNQNTVEEINIDYVKEQGIKVVRRLTGGGAVYHDLGNLNYTFIENSQKKFNDFKGFCLPITKALNELGINAQFSGRNDMTIDGKKFSGTAQCQVRHRVMHHGTLLFSAITGDLKNALKPKGLKFEGKSVKSVSSRVTNITEHLTKEMDVLEFRDYIMAFLKGKENEVETFTPEEIKEIMKLKEQKYGTWQWNYGNSPKFTKYEEGKFKGGIVEVALEIKGIIKEIRIFGDFFSMLDVEELENLLQGIPYQEKEVKKVLDNIELDKYLLNVSQKDLLSLFF